MDEEERSQMAQELIRRLGTVGPEGDRKLDADIWYAMTDHRVAPGRYTRLIDDAFGFALAFHRTGDVRFGLAQRHTGDWTALAIVRDGARRWDLESIHPHAAPALMQAALRVFVLHRPAAPAAQAAGDSRSLGACSSAAPR